MYDNYVNQFLTNAPKGWYETSMKLSEILKEAIKIFPIKKREKKR